MEADRPLSIVGCVARAVVKPATPNERCPRCDGAVGCGIATGACWCTEVTLPVERQRELAAQYEGCLCPACLRELEQAPSDRTREPLLSEVDQTLMRAPRP